ncbi:hypothetical protein Asulf_00680 [Archaeoglobus sulfaticallidus PM70-1]|uniref:CDAN1-interacting nuclease 1 n=1 Tax=Archaeoglobus sulfaticallidus PM70-1 TaxID=387631 RepID=N0BCH3_9EURY|nr:TPD domain-containing protein [Archaeoglobus sulfaticallidus]AGK60698.1 hypothetical protein Asulf_00680 [Archaeoglobus sulfaticallidus PM70-1]
MEITHEEYLKLRKNLRNLSDLRNERYYRGMLFSILSQKKVDEVKVNYGKMISRAEELADFWEREKRFPRWFRLTPTMQIRILLKALEYSKKEIRNSFLNPNNIDDEDLRRETWKSIFTDYIYSPFAIKNQYVRGDLGEKILEEWLKSRDIEFKTEKDLRKEFSKTPDFYFPDGVNIAGEEIRWIESKALFGDFRIHWVYWKKQFSKYLEMFGNGFVIYWFGRVKEIDKVKFLKEDMFRNELARNLLEMKIYMTGIKGKSDRDLEHIVERYRIKNIFEVDSDFPDIGLEVARNGIDFEEVYSGEFIKAVTSVIDSFSKGPVLVVGDQRDWKKCRRRHIGWVLRNMGFQIVNLR